MGIAGAVAALAVALIPAQRLAASDASRARPVPAVVAFWTAKRGLLGSATPLQTSGTISLTRDGGRTWHVVRRLRHAPVWVDAVGRNVAWVAVGGCSNGDACRQRLLQTTDGGRTWRMIARRAPSAASFVDAHFGLGMHAPYGQYGPGSALEATRDGGRSWSGIRSPCGPWMDGWVALESRAARAVFCVGQPSAGYQPKKLFVTRNAGRTWSRARRGIGGSGYGAGLTLAPDGFGLALVIRGAVAATVDGGRDWHYVSVAQAEVDFVSGGDAIAGGRAWVVMRHNAKNIQLVRTRDRGRTWRVVRKWK